MAKVFLSICFLVYSFTIFNNATGEVKFKSVLTCEDQTAHFKCDGSKVIRIENIFWGRRHDHICRGKSNSNRCDIKKAASKVKKLCNLKSECSVRATTKNLGRSWWYCGRATYYLQASYSCIGGDVQPTKVILPTNPVIRPTQIKQLCEDKNSMLSCNSGQVLQIEDAFFGRKDTGTCNPNGIYVRTACYTNVIDEMRRCNNKNYCLLASSKNDFGYPCPSGIPVYLEIQYRCVSSGIQPTQRPIIPTQRPIIPTQPRKGIKTVCEFRTAIFSCQSNQQVIKIKSAFFGRQDSSTCPTGNTWNRCYKDVTDVVKYGCHNQETCILNSDAGVFGDPCKGTSKYLEVEFDCVPRGRIPFPTDMKIPTVPLATYAPGGNTGNRQCGVSNMQTSRIIKGSDAHQGEFPWQVAIYKGNSFICGGSIISPNWIITAAHCFQDLKPYKYHVVLGDYDRTRLEGVERKHEVNRIIRHYNFERGIQHDSDIALIELRQPAFFDNNVSPICSPYEDYTEGESCVISGWGQTTYPGSVTGILQRADLRIRSRDDCQKKLRNAPGKPGDQITRNMFCVGKSDGTSSCHGDSGGPLVCLNRYNQWVLRGVVSWGSPRCSTNDMYTVLTNVKNYKSWVNSYVRW